MKLKTLGYIVGLQGRGLHVCSRKHFDAFLLQVDARSPSLSKKSKCSRLKKEMEDTSRLPYPNDVSTMFSGSSGGFLENRMRRGD